VDIKPKADLQKTLQQKMPQKNEKVFGAAKMYEQQFLREMVKAMRSTVSESDLVQKSMGEKIYSEQLDDQYVEQWSDQGGIGLADMIYEHIMERYYPSKSMMQRPRGPMPLEKNKNIEMKVEDKGNNKSSYYFSPPPDKELNVVTAPWEGRVSSTQTNGDRKTITLEHDNGLKSVMTFIGTLTPDLNQVEAGQRLGLSTKDLIWALESNT